MNTKRIILAILIAIGMVSCRTSYYQVYKATPSDKSAIAEDLLAYEDDNCIVMYNFWSEGGNIGFRFVNKTDKNIYLNMEETFFVLNGIAYNYYRDRVFTHSASSSLSSSYTNTAMYSASASIMAGLAATMGVAANNAKGSTTSSGSSISYNEVKIVCIPPKASKIIMEYNITQSPYRDCDLLVNSFFEVLW